MKKTIMLFIGAAAIILPLTAALAGDEVIIRVPEPSTLQMLGVGIASLLGAGGIYSIFKRK